MTQITVLRTRGPLLAKQWKADGSIADYDNPRQYTFQRHEVQSIDWLHQLLKSLQGHPDRCIIRGQPKAEVQHQPVVLRNLDTFEDQPSHLFMVDVDRFEGTVLEFAATLPACFQDASFVWQLSGSHAHPSKGNGLRAHLWFWLATPLTCEQAEAWAKQWIPQADCTVHRTVQVNYTAAPVMDDGVTDPMNARLGFVEGMLTSSVIIPPDMPVPEGQTRRTRRAERASGMVDPREKPGIIGALARAHAAAEIVTLFPDHFEAGSKEHRITWLAGGGAKEGIGVADNGTHIFNTQSTSPIGDRAANLFDFVRAHVFGHLDEGIDEDVLDLDVTAAPSYKATIEWAYSLPEVVAEMGSDEAKEVAEAAADKQVEEATSETRKEKLDRLLELIAKAPDRQALQKMAHKVGKAGTYDDADINDMVEAMKKRCLALGSRQKTDTVADWFRRGRASNVQGFPCLDEKGNPKPVIENLEVLCTHLGYTIRQNEILKRQEIVIPDVEYEQGNVENATVSRLLSECAKVNLTTSMTLVKAYVTEIAARNTFNPVLEWIESAPWDGTSRFAALADTLVLKPGFDPAMRALMLRKWCIQAVAAAASDRPISTRGVLTLAGPQYLGKSRWLKSLLPGMEHLGMMGKQIDPHNKDSVKIAISHWLCELGELDGVLRRTDNEALKNFLSLDIDSFRLPYAPAETRFQRRTVFTASVNTETFMQDETGNTRLWVIPVVDIRLQHGIEMQQLWAEALSLWRAGELHYFGADEMRQVEQATEQFQAPSTVTDRLLMRFHWDAAKRGDADVVWVKRSGAQIADLCGFQVRTKGESSSLGTQLKKLSGRDSVSNGQARLHWVPMKKDELETEGL